MRHFTWNGSVQSSEIIAKVIPVKVKLVSVVVARGKGGFGGKGEKSNGPKCGKTETSLVKRPMGRGEVWQKRKDQKERGKDCKKKYSES